MTQRVASDADAAAVLDGIKYVLFDCDGVLWSGDRVFPGVPEALTTLRRSGRELRFVTNNATMSRAEMVQRKFSRLGKDIDSREVMSSAGAAAAYVRSLGPTGFEGNVLVLGNPGLHDEIRASLAPGYITYGQELANWGPGSDGGYEMNAIAACWHKPLLPAPGPDAGDKRVSLEELKIRAVVVGLYFDVNLSTAAIAGMCLQQHQRIQDAPRCHFIATNRDPQISIGEAGWLLPGAGTLVAMIQTVSGRAPDVVCGKPGQQLFDIFLTDEEQRTGVRPTPSECLMIGDRISTDIAFGKAAGTRTLFVLTGCETEDNAQGEVRPDFIASSLVDVVSRV